jgi:hypothetical protein
MEIEGGAVRRDATSRTLLRNEGLRHPMKFLRGLNKLACDSFTRAHNQASEAENTPPPLVSHSNQAYLEEGADNSPNQPGVRGFLFIPC